MKDLGEIAYQWEDELQLRNGHLPAREGARVGDRQVLFGDVVIAEKWNPEKKIKLESIDLLWFGVHLQRQLAVMGRMKLDEVTLSDPAQSFELLFWKEDSLLLVKNMQDRSQPAVRLEFRDFKTGFGRFRQSLWGDIMQRYPDIIKHPQFFEIERHFR